MWRYIKTTGFCFGICMANPSWAQSDYPYQPVRFVDVKIVDSFWSPRIETNRNVTIPFAFRKSEATGRLKNFEVAAKVNRGEITKGKFCSKYGYDDSDVFKIIEGASYSLSTQDDPELTAFLDSLIASIAAAQEPDGYLYTMRTINPEKSWAQERWVNDRTRSSHELYNVGHMYEAAVAHYQATGKRTLLDVAIKNANLLCRTFGPGKKVIVSGHQEVEIGLAKLYRITGDKRYLDLAKFFLDERGKGEVKGGEYNQDHMPVAKQEEAVGHAVRAAYMYSAMADIAALTGDTTYIKAIDRIWENVASGKLYITGGIGARSDGEAFGDNYELPNLTAYNETCAAIANVFWNFRMFLLHGDSKYMDVLEQSLYNNVLSGVSLEGTAFFYPNPLESQGNYTRSEWFDCSCCPSNITRFISSIAGYIYAQRGDSIFVNLYISGTGNITAAGKKITVHQATRFPWDGTVSIQFGMTQPSELNMMLRIPGWAVNRPLPESLYQYQDQIKTPVEILVNGKRVKQNMSHGYMVLHRTWKDGDRIELRLPMLVRRVIASPEVAEDRGKVCLTRGPIVFCAEGIDNDLKVDNIILPEGSEPLEKFESSLLNGVITLDGTVFKLEGDGYETPVQKVSSHFKAIPYYAWCHRGTGTMNVWFYRPDKVFEPDLRPASSLFLEDIDVAMKRYTDQDIRYTLGDDYPGRESELYSTPVRLTLTNNINAKAYSKSDGESELVTGLYSRVTVKSALQVNQVKPGVDFFYYEGKLRQLPDFNTMTPLKSGVLNNFDILTVRDTADFYSMRFSGLIKIPLDGVYTFCSNSDDGSRLMISGEIVLTNDGLHEPVIQCGQIALAAGYHAIIVEFFEYGSGELLEISLESAGMKKQVIPDDLLFHETK